MDANQLFLHDVRNQIGIIIGYCELLLDTTPPADPRHADVLEIQKAALAALALMPRNSGAS